MNKTRQYELIRWLKKQSAPAQRWLRLSMLLGLLSGLLIIAQAWLLATLLQSLIIDKVPRTEFITDFGLLAGTFAIRAVISWLRERVGFICGMKVRQQIRKTVLDRLEQLGPAWVKANQPEVGRRLFWNKLKICRITILAIFHKCIWPFLFRC